jgi:hypothetical protein
MVPAKGGACSTQAFVKDLDLVSIDRRKDLPAGTLGKCRQGNIAGRRTPLFFLPLAHAPFFNQPVDPVLGSTPGHPGPVLDIGDGE